MPVSDPEALTCALCPQEFSLFSRRHWCRSCKRTICAACCTAYRNSFTAHLRGHHEENKCIKCAYEQKEEEIRRSKMIAAGGGAAGAAASGAEKTPTEKQLEEFMRDMQKKQLDMESEHKKAVSLLEERLSKQQQDHADEMSKLRSELEEARRRLAAEKKRADDEAAARAAAERARKEDKSQFDELSLHAAGAARKAEQEATAARKAVGELREEMAQLRRQLAEEREAAEKAARESAHASEVARLKALREKAEAEEEARRKRDQAKAEEDARRQRQQEEEAEAEARRLKEQQEEEEWRKQQAEAQAALEVALQLQQQREQQQAREASPSPARPTAEELGVHGPGQKGGFRDTWTDYKPADAFIAKIVKPIEGDIKARLGNRRMTELRLTFYRSQNVAGVNYDVKALADGRACLFRIFRGLANNPVTNIVSAKFTS